MVLRIISVALWLLLGVVYFFIYSNGTKNCCNDQISEKTEPVIVNDTIFQESTIKEIQPLQSVLEERNIPDHGVIYFSENSTNFNNSETLLQYLTSIGQLTAERDFEIQLIGHQSEQENQEGLDRQRCQAVQNFLIDLGVDEKLITIDARGNIDSKAYLDNGNLRLDQRVEIRLKE